MRKVHRRDVFFFPGYDIAGVGRYHRYLKRQCGWYARRFDASFEISALTPSPIEHWSIAEVVAHWPEGRVVTRFHICDWRADIANDYGPSAIFRAQRTLAAWWRMTQNGQTRRIARAAPLFALVVGAPLLLLLARLLVVLAALWAIGTGGVVSAVGCVLAVLALYWLWRAGGVAYETFFGSYLSYLDRQLYGPKDARNGRLNAAIDALCAHTGFESSDEVIIAGHSFGAVSAMRAAARISATKPEISLLTVGSNLPCIALEPTAHDLRDNIASLYQTKQTTWREYFAPQDSLCFPHSNPLKDFRISLPGPHQADVKIRSAVFDEFVSRRKIRKFRWNALRMHFQFMMAADKQGAYDWHRFLLGPETLKDATK